MLVLLVIVIYESYLLSVGIFNYFVGTVHKIDKY